MSKKFIDYYLEAVTAKKDSGGGGSATLIDKNVSANGTYNASSDSADGYKKVVVDVPNTYAAGDEGKVVSSGALVAQSAHAKVTQNGTIDTTLNNSVEVDVPNSYAAGDEGKVVSSGALVAQTAHAKVTQNGTIDTTLNNSVEVDVSGGGGTDNLQKVFDGTLQTLSYSGVTSIGAYMFQKQVNLESINMPDTEAIGSGAFDMTTPQIGANSKLTTINVPKLKTIGSQAFEYCYKLGTPSLVLDFQTVTSLDQYCFRGVGNATHASQASAELLANAAIWVFRDLSSFNGTNAFNNAMAKAVIITNTSGVITLGSSQKFFSGSFVDAIYVPDDLVDSYKAASNWTNFSSKIHGLSDCPYTY